MTVKGLIEKLRTLPENAEITVASMGTDYETGEYVIESDLAAIFSFVDNRAFPVITLAGENIKKNGEELEVMPYKFVPKMPPSGSC